MPPIELTEEQFLKLVKARMEKAKLDGGEGPYRAHLELLKKYEEYKRRGLKMRFYLNPEGEVWLVPYTTEELEIFRKKYLESGIY